MFKKSPYEERMKIVEKLRKKMDICKINILFDDFSKEGVWTVFCDDNSKKNYESGIENLPIKVFCIEPIPRIEHLIPGIEISATTKNTVERPFVKYSDIKEDIERQYIYYDNSR